MSKSSMLSYSHAENIAMPASILLDKWLDLGFFWQGDVVAAELTRLYEQVDEMAQMACPKLSVSCRLSKKDGINFLSFDVIGDIWLNCHRCLQPMAVPVNHYYEMAILTCADDVNKIDNKEYILVDELGENKRYLPIKDLLEDGLLLSLPIAVHHDDCQMAVEFYQDEEDVVVQDNPFAVLASLKGKLS